MSLDTTLSPADILADVVEPDRPTMSAPVAREFLALRINEAARERIRELLGKNNAGTISSAEKATLDNYLCVGELLDLMQAKARLSLRQAGLSV
jgi:hypothetical protein